jgi:hypothetical protein
MKRLSTVLRLASVACAFVVTACSSAAPMTAIPSASGALPTASSAAQSQATASAAAATTAGPSTAGGLDCGARDYPCSLRDVSAATFAASEALAEQARSLLDAGSSLADAAVFLQAQPDVAEVESEDPAIRFRLKGGRSEWIEGGDALLTSSALEDGATLQADGVGDVNLAAYHDVVGGEPPTKRAVVLSPMLWDFGASDDGPAVAKVLGATRGYENSVTFLANSQPLERTVDIAMFKGWGTAQVVHVASHGLRICKSTCRAVIVARFVSGIVDNKQVGSDLSLAEVPAETGIDVLRTQKPKTTMLALNADFFRSQYPGGLSQTLVFFNACETNGGGATDLGDAIRGTTSEFLGWSKKVQSDFARLTALSLYQHLAEDGTTLGKAFDALGSQRTDPTFPNAVLTLGKREAGGDLRIRDVVTLDDPTGGQPLAAGDSIDFLGSFKDGKPDVAQYQVTVDGIDTSDAANTMLHVDLGGHAAAPVAVSTGTSTQEGNWVLTGEVPLETDLQDPTPMPMLAVVDLPEGGTSRQQLSVTLAGTGLPTGMVWHGTITDVNTGGSGMHLDIPSTISADVTFTYLPESSPAYADTLTYAVTGGTFKWHLGGDDGHGCVWSAPDTIVLLTPETVDPGGALHFVTALSPPSYWGFFSVTGPLVPVTSVCTDSFGTGTATRPNRVDGAFTFPGGTSNVPVTGNTITGSYVAGSSTVTWSFTRIK